MTVKAGFHCFKPTQNQKKYDLQYALQRPDIITFRSRRMDEHLEQQCKVSSLLDFSASPISFPLEAVTEPHQRKGKLLSSGLSDVNFYTIRIKYKLHNYIERLLQ